MHGPCFREAAQCELGLFGAPTWVEHQENVNGCGRVPRDTREKMEGESVKLVTLFDEDEKRVMGRCAGQHPTGCSAGFVYLTRAFGDARLAGQGIPHGPQAWPITSQQGFLQRRVVGALQELAKQVTHCRTGIFAAGADFQAADPPDQGTPRNLFREAMAPATFGSFQKSERWLTATNPFDQLASGLLAAHEPGGFWQRGRAPQQSRVGECAVEFVCRGSIGGVKGKTVADQFGESAGNTRILQDAGFRPLQTL